MMVRQENEDRIKKLEDIEDIKKLQAKYAYFIDSENWDELSDLFVEDVIAEYEPLIKFNNRAELVPGLKKSTEASTMMCHQMMNPYIELNGDRATGVWYLFGPFVSKGPQGEIAHWIQGRYNNEYVRVDDKWKFSKIHFKFNFNSPYEDGWVKTKMFEP